MFAEDEFMSRAELDTAKPCHCWYLEVQVGRIDPESFELAARILG